MAGEDARRWGWVVAATTLISLLRLAVPGSVTIGIGFLFVVPSGLAAWWFGRRAGLATAAICIALYVGAIVIRPVDHAVPGALLRAVAIAVAAVVLSELRERTAALTAMRDELEPLRMALTPPTLPTLPGLDAAVVFLPAEHGVSGDFYLVTNGPHGTNIAIVGDVTGHGPAAAKLATFARATLASVAASSDDPAEILTLVNGTLVDRWEHGDFLTASCVVHDPAAQTIRLATAGHPAPIRLSDLAELRTSGAPPLGVEPGSAFPTEQQHLAPRDGVLLYTDGLTDAGRSADRYGDMRVREVLRRCAGGSAADIAQALRESVSRHAGERFRDDVCILVLRAA